MKELKLDGLLLTHPPDLTYLTNFTGDDSVGLVTNKAMHIVTDFRYQEQALLDYGACGKGLIALHCASYCFLNSPKCIELGGAQFFVGGAFRF